MPVITTTDLDIADNDDGPSDGLGNVLDTTVNKTRKPGDRPSLA
jgi:hypothetical protein